MAALIFYKEDRILFNNKSFANTLSLSTAAAEHSAKPEEMAYVSKMIHDLNNFVFFDFDIETHTPTLEEKKFWYRMFLKAAHLIFERNLGTHDNDISWQPLRIHQLYATANLFLKAIKE